MTRGRVEHPLREGVWGLVDWRYRDRYWGLLVGDFDFIGEFDVEIEGLDNDCRQRQMSDGGEAFGVFWEIDELMRLEEFKFVRLCRGVFFFQGSIIRSS